MTDPICGMNVEPNSAAGSHVHRGQTYYFCSRHCLAKFKEDPEKFLKSPATDKAAHGRAQSHRDTAQASKKDSPEDAIYVCPMDPEVRESRPGACPKCGMALEPAAPAAPSVQTEYVCPMHLQIVGPEPGACPICGMALEPRTVTLADEANPELVEMTRRFWAGVGFSAPVAFLAMSDLIPGQPIQHSFSPQLLNWVQLVLATPVVLWGGWPFFQRGWASIINRSLNMFTLIAIGVGTAFIYSLVATLFPDAFPESFRGHGGGVGVYFDAAAVITTLVLLG
jgi:P-type Cu+ transporter